VTVHVPRTVVPHSSHITQPLDVGVFAPLKQAVGRSLDRLLRVGVARLEKVEWVECYMKARTEAFTAKNINRIWHGSGLFPFNPSKVLRHLSDDVESTASISSTDDIPKTPSTTHSNPLPLDNIQQTPSPFDIQQFTIQLADLAIRNAINTPLRPGLEMSRAEPSGPSAWLVRASSHDSWARYRGDLGCSGLS